MLPELMSFPAYSIGSLNDSTVPSVEFSDIINTVASSPCVPLSGDADGEAEIALLSTPQEHEVIQQLAELPEEILRAAHSLDPSRINRYVTELSARFHRFYNTCRIKGEEEGVLKARLLLADCVRSVIANCLGILGVSAPEQM